MKLQLKSSQTAYNIHPKTAYRELREASNKLYERSIIIRNEQQTMKLRWASSIIADNPYPTDVFPDEHWKRVVIFFNPQILPYLSNLKKPISLNIFNQIFQMLAVLIPFDFMN